MDELIGPYRLERRLGSGGMGVVHLACGPDGKRVAIKVLHPHWSAREDYRERFRSEAAAARRVARFCTAAVLDASFGEPSYLVTEYIEGRTLAEAVTRDGALAGGQLELLAIGTAMALGAIHGAGIVHRDLKPSNIILSPYGPKVIDFGIAQLTDVAGETGPFVMGTPPVIAPERLVGQRASAAADVFSWGCVVAYAGTGRWPFDGATSEQIYYRIMHGQPDLNGLDQRLHPLVQAALAKDPAERPSVLQLLEQMTGLGLQLAEPTAQPPQRTQRIPLPQQTQTAQPPQSAQPAQPQPSPRQSRARSRGRLITALAAGTAAVALVSVAAMLLWPDPPAFKLVHNDDFSGRYGWSQGTRTGAMTKLANGHYRMSVDNPLLQENAGGLVAPASVNTSVYADVIVTAKASGTDAYGVWCRGNPHKAPDAKYEFYVTSTGEAAILKKSPKATGNLGPYLKPFHRAFTPTATNRIQARCQSTPNGTRLSLTVNDRRVATVTDTVDPLAPGAVGLTAWARTAPQASADFDSFTVETP
ncbi:serine/threonine-protein kinase [Actinomadura sp. 6N118]|uniref:serine/threonine-protein kinase n=1 Tax=Actinomadura sp. 6N118 TaxID=3375151 RepID=UPI0037A428B2